MCNLFKILKRPSVYIDVTPSCLCPTGSMDVRRKQVLRGSGDYTFWPEGVA